VGRSARDVYERLVGDDRVSGRLYTDTAIFDDEMARIHHREWVFVAHESEVAVPVSSSPVGSVAKPVVLTATKPGRFAPISPTAVPIGAQPCAASDRGQARYLRCPLPRLDLRQRRHARVPTPRARPSGRRSTAPSTVCSRAPLRPLPGVRVRQLVERRADARRAPRPLVRDDDDSATL